MPEKFLHTSLRKTPGQSVQHDPDIQKQVLVQPTDSQSNLTTVSHYTLKPGQIISPHRHITMDETFYILEGQLQLTIDGTRVQLQAQELILIPAGKEHSGKAGKAGCKMLGFGVALDDG